jgi:hypothetical protein
MDSSEQDWARYEETLAESAERYGTPGTDSYAARIPTPPAFLRHPHSYATRIPTPPAFGIGARFLAAPARWASRSWSCARRSLSRGSSTPTTVAARYER